MFLSLFERFLRGSSAGWGDKNVMHIARRFRLFVQHTAQGCGTRHVVTSLVASVHAFRDHAQNTGIYSVSDSLYNMLRKDVEQGKLSQASMPLATIPKTLAFTALLSLYALQVADSGLTHSISETKTPCNKE